MSKRFGRNQKRKFQERLIVLEAKISALTETLANEIFTNDVIRNHLSSKVQETESRCNDKINNKDEEIKRLQKRVKIYKNKITEFELEKSSMISQQQHNDMINVLQNKITEQEKIIEDLKIKVDNNQRECDKRTNILSKELNKCKEELTKKNSVMINNIMELEKIRTEYIILTKEHVKLLEKLKNIKTFVS